MGTLYVMWLHFVLRLIAIGHGAATGKGGLLVLGGEDRVKRKSKPKQQHPAHQEVLG